MLIDPILDGDEEDDDKNQASEQVENADDVEEDVVVEGDDDEERTAKTKSRDDEEGLTEEQKREARRLRKKRQKERARLAREHDKAMIAGLQQSLAEVNAKLAKLENKGADDEVSKIKTAKRNAENRVAFLKAQIKKAAEEGVGDIAELTDQLVEVRADLKQIDALETDIVKQREKDAEEEKNGGISEEEKQRLAQNVRETINNNVRVFTGKHDWYIMSDDAAADADEEDIEDSELVRELDKQLTAQGSNPATAKHWQTLENMMREKLPHRFATEEEDDAPQRQKVNGKRKPAMVGGSGRGGNGGGGNEGGYRLSKERVDAMKEAGIWDDPVRKKRAIERYKAYDKQQQSARN